MRFLGARVFQVAAVAAAVVAMGASDAQAFGRKHAHGYSSSAGSYGSYGGYGSYASYGSAGSYGSYGGYASSGSYGSYKRPGLFARWHARKAAKHSYGSSASYGSYGSSSYGSSSYGSYGGSYVVSYGGSSGGYYGGSSGSYGGAIIDSYESHEAAPLDAQPGPPAVPENAAPMDGQPPAPPSAAANEGTIWVTLPAEAKVFVNDRPTTSAGAERHYVSRGLEAGRTYSYKLRVEYQRDGQPVVEDKLVKLQAGSDVRLHFGDGSSVEQTAKTELKLHVPAAAKVTLAGAATEQTGTDRTFATDSLQPGQVWDGYVVRVELEQDGQTLVEEKTLSIEGGKTYELSFELKGEATKVAAL